MELLDASNARERLVALGWLAADERVEIAPLLGGVSNEVLYVARLDHPGNDWVIKQVREQLRVAEPWFARKERIWREVAVLRICGELLEPTGADDPLRAEIPRIVHESRDDFLFAMTAAPRDHRVWKRELLARRADPEIARQCGLLLGRLHSRSWLDERVAAAMADRSIFDELRLDPYYRFTASRFPDWQASFAELVEWGLAEPRALVHADFSPKNLLVAGERLVMVDFETGHYGDPAFDLGFFLSHLVLKTVLHAPAAEPYRALIDVFWQAYRCEVEPRVGAAAWRGLEARGVLNLAGCAWARLDGKSPVEYLTAPERRDALRRCCQAWFSDRPATLAEACATLPNRFD